jgi:hypothetical protein
MSLAQIFSYLNEGELPLASYYLPVSPGPILIGDWHYNHEQSGDSKPPAATILQLVCMVAACVLLALS